MTNMHSFLRIPTFIDMFFKRAFDIVAALFGIILFLPITPIIVFLVSISSQGAPFFSQRRVGRSGKLFTCIKFRTMYSKSEHMGSITTACDSRITPIGRFLRRFKLDELPQLWNVLTGKMSFVGPRPDVAGYADALTGDDRRILDLRPGITGPASLFFRYEEGILAGTENPKEFNDTVIWPLKVKMNLAYLNNWSFWRDIGYIIVTVIPHANRILRLVPESPRSKEQLLLYAERLNDAR